MTRGALWVVLVAAFCANTAWAAGRVALVIGNSDYAHVSRLPNPANDAQDLSAALERVGFQVTMTQNLEYKGMRLALRDFADAAADADVALVYFAGHGIEIDNTNYLIPVNAELKSDRDIEFEAIRLESVIAALDTAAGVRIVLLDACRNNPFAATMTRTSATRSIGRGLARVDPGAVLVGYAARSGTLALDGDGRNSPYAQALLTHLEEPGLELGFFFRKVRDTVGQLTDGYQQPFTYGSLPGRGIYLTPAAAPAPAPPPPEQAVVTDTGESRFFEAATALNSPRAWALYFDAFPRGDMRDAALEAEAVLYRQNIQARYGGRDPSAARPLDWMRREAVRYLSLSSAGQLTIQSALSRLGYDPGPIDGALGQRSFAAIADFQRDRRLLADGVPDRATLDALGIKPPDRDVGWFPVAATLGARYKVDQLRVIEPDPRVHRLAEAFPGQVLNYGFYDGRVYAVVRNAFGMPWDSTQALARKAGGSLAAFASREEERATLELFRYDNLFWTERAARDTYSFAGSDRVDVVGPSFGLEDTADGWTWGDGEALTYRNWMRGFPEDGPGKRYGEFVHGPRAEGNLLTDWRWGNWHNARNAILIEVE